jgi:hypothetical protein
MDGFKTFDEVACRKGDSPASGLSTVAARYKQGRSGAWWDDEDLFPSELCRQSRYARDRFVAEARFPFFTSSAKDGFADAPKDGCAVNWNYAYRLAESIGDPNQPTCSGDQSTGNCVSAAIAFKTIPQLLATAQLGLKLPAINKGELTSIMGSTWHYARRGYCGQGWNGYDMAYWVDTDGVLLRQNYPDAGYNLTDENTDEEYSKSTWCRSGPPSSLVNIGRDHKFNTAVSILDDVRLETISDALMNGCVVNVLSNSTPRTGGSPISSGNYGIGGHSQCFVGIDRRPHMLDRYNIDKAIVFVGNQWTRQYNQSNWDSEWGVQPHGTDVCDWDRIQGMLDRGTIYIYSPDPTGFGGQPVLWGGEQKNTPAPNNPAPIPPEDPTNY